MRHKNYTSRCHVGYTDPKPVNNCHWKSSNRPLQQLLREKFWRGRNDKSRETNRLCPNRHHRNFRECINFAAIQTVINYVNETNSENFRPWKSSLGPERWGPQGRIIIHRILSRWPPSCRLRTQHPGALLSEGTTSRMWRKIMRCERFCGNQHQVTTSDVTSGQTFQDGGLM